MKSPALLAFLLLHAAAPSAQLHAGSPDDAESLRKPLRDMIVARQPADGPEESQP